MPRFARDVDDLDAAVRDLWNLECEQLANQVRVGPREGDLWAAGSASNPDDVALDALTVLVVLAGNLFCRRQQSLGAIGFAADSDDDHSAGIRTRVTLNDTADDFTLM